MKIVSIIDEIIHSRLDIEKSIICINGVFTGKVRKFNNNSKTLLSLHKLIKIKVF